MKWDKNVLIVRRFGKEELVSQPNKQTISVPTSPFMKGKRVIKFKKRHDTKPNINVETWADVDAKTYMCWGDYWAKLKLMNALAKLGANCNVTPQDADATIYLFGSPFPQRNNFPYMYNPQTYNVMWFYSHPNKIIANPGELKRYNKIFCLSPKFIQFIKQQQWPCNLVDEALLSCTDFNIPEQKHKERIDILFVGNARGGLEYGRKAMHWLEPPPKIVVKVYGHKWYNHDYVHSKWFADTYWPYEQLNQIYNKAKITLVDGHEDMNQYGFVQMKIFDVLASGGFVISLYNTGMEEIFGEVIPMYKNQRQMNILINHFLKHPEDRYELMEKGREIALQYTYGKNAQVLLDDIRKAVKK